MAQLHGDFYFKEGGWKIFLFFMEEKIRVMFECLSSYHCQIGFSVLVDCQSLVYMCVFYPETFDCLYLYLGVIPWMLT